MKQPQEGVLLYKTSCDKCGSSDANAVYSSNTSYCFSCRHFETTETNNKKKKVTTMRDDLLHGEYTKMVARKIPEEICKLYNYRLGKDSKGTVCQIANYYNSDKEIVAQKLRYADKTFKFIGKAKEALLFGQQAFGEGGKKLTITEGEIDALSVATAFSGKYPIVSIKNGASSSKKEILEHYDWIVSFDEIYLWFDNDEPGRKAIDEVVQVLPTEKVRIIAHPEYKDASDVLVNLGVGGVTKAFYNATTYKPEGFVSPLELLEEAVAPVEWGLPWMYDKLTKLSYGRRYGEIVTLGAGVSVGKTDFLMQQIAKDLEDGHKVATFMLEQSKVETLKRIAGKKDGIFYHLPDKEYDIEKLQATVRQMNNLYIYDNFGKIDWDTIKSKIRSATHSFGCKIFYIDNLTALNAHSDDERRNLDAMMEEIASLAKELHIWILLVSHLNPPKSGPSHEAGGKVEQGQFTGSRAIMRWSQFMIGVERNTLHEDEDLRKQGLVRCIKDRFSGKATGHTIGFVYDVDTGLTYETEEVKAIEQFDDNEDEDY